MIVTHKITMDLVRKDKMPCIDMMQDDKYSRDLEFRLQAQGIDCPPPQDCSILVRYRKADGHQGAYDTMPDGSRAWRIAGSKVTVRVAPQVCTAVGKTDLSVTLLQGQKELSLFAVQLNIHSRLEGALPSEDYINIDGFLPQTTGAVAGQYLRVAAVDETGRITALETAGDGDLGTEGKSAYAYAQEGGYTGTEEEFAAKLAAQLPTACYVTLTEANGSYTADKTTAELEAAYQAGRPLFCLCPWYEEQLCLPFACRIYEGVAWIFAAAAAGQSLLAQITDFASTVEYVQMLTTDTLPDPPTLLPNPYRLKFTGAISASYDGSLPVTVTIPAELPAVTEENNGAFLRVVNGAWSAAAVDAAEEVSF